MPQQTPVKYYAFTYHCDSFEDAIVTVKTWPTKYCLVGKEICPTTGQKHLQGYCGFEEPKRLTQLKKLNNEVHWEPAEGTYAENWVYCTKDGDFESWGEEPKNVGERRKDLDRHVVELAISGKLNEIIALYPQHWLRYQNNIKRTRRDFLKVPEDLEDVCGVWICGPTGCGKSRKARQDYPNFHPKLPNKWWDGYQDQPNVIIDDVDKNHKVLGYHFKIWADRYGFLCEVKNDSVAIRPKKIIITSQYRPNEIWGDDPETLEAIERRYQIVDMFPVAEFIQSHD